MRRSNEACFPRCWEDGKGFRSVWLAMHRRAKANGSRPRALALPRPFLGIAEAQSAPRLLDPVRAQGTTIVCIHRSTALGIGRRTSWAKLREALCGADSLPVCRSHSSHTCRCTFFVHQPCKTFNDHNHHSGHASNVNCRTRGRRSPSLLQTFRGIRIDAARIARGSRRSRQEVRRRLCSLVMIGRPNGPHEC